MINDIQDERLTLVVNTCDKYSDVLSLFFSAYERNCADVNIPVVINAENNIYENYPARVHNFIGGESGDKWGGRLIETLKSIESDYVLMVYDDFILEDNLDILGLNDAIELLENDKNASVVYIVNTSLPSDGSCRNGFHKVKDRVDYKLNSAPGVWRRKDLIDYTDVYDNPWAWEVFGTYRTYGIGKNFYTVLSSRKDVYPYNYSKGGAIYRGKWVREVVESKIIDYKLDIDPLIRGYSEEGMFEPRNLKWKINFMLTGYRMVGVKSLLFIYRYLKVKFNVFS